MRDGYAAMIRLTLEARADMLESAAGYTDLEVVRELRAAREHMNANDPETLRWLACLCERRVADLDVLHGSRRVPAIGSRVWGARGVFYAAMDAWGIVCLMSHDSKSGELLVGVLLGGADHSSREGLVWVPASKVTVQS